MPGLWEAQKVDLVPTFVELITTEWVRMAICKQLVISLQLGLLP